SETLAPIHNSVTPVDEMLPAGVRVAIGTDDIADIYKPFSDGDMWTELRFLLEATHLYDMDALVEIATTNGRKALFLD
ncbi:MAG: amidohydrolase family protein, partial [Candidatus Saccharimonadales bacterium]